MWEPQIVAAVQVIGLTGQSDYTNWALNVATENEIYVVSIVLEVLLDE